ncbi:UNVERIFIED_CONTAM: NAC domain-containing protein 53 [Sesamum radiatum]|uniref:NAC domain-containing protein 53 n=1 Tax=Sesamum radiatum TaxID=300843 RepID=A0AAW2K9U7_SESRA
MDSVAGKKKSSGSSSMLAPGFRFHPTDEELVRYYLRRKVCGKGFRFDAISEIDIYKAEPWDLPSFSRLKTRDLEWYFFSVLDKKYGNGARTNRATEKGYWKTTGKDRAVYHKAQIVGMKKTLVYHSGRAPKGQRTNWVMHEYRLADLELEKAGIVQVLDLSKLPVSISLEKDAFVLCRVFQKSGSGPKTANSMGHHLWKRNGMMRSWNWFQKRRPLRKLTLLMMLIWMVMTLSSIAIAFAFEIMGPFQRTIFVYDMSFCLFLDQMFHLILLLFHQSSNLQMEAMARKPESVNDTQQLLVNAGEQYCEAEQHEDKNFYDLPAPYDMAVRAVKHEYIGESSKSGNSDDLDYLLDEPFLDSSDNLQYGNEGFIESNDLPNPAAETNTSAFDMLEEYLTFFDANDDNTQHFAYDPSVMLGSEELISDHALLPPQELNGETEKSTLPSGQIDDNNDKDDASPSDKQDSAKYESGNGSHPTFDNFSVVDIAKASNFVSRVVQMCNIHSSNKQVICWAASLLRPALAAEFPSKSTALRVNSLSQPSSSVHVTAGMIQIRDLTTDGNGRVQSFGKPENFNIVLSFGFSRGNDGSASLESSVSILPGKTLSTLSRGWFCFIFFWVLILSLSFKIGTCICAK